MGYEVLAPQGQFHGKVFAFPVRVYYEDTDAGGVVYYANYLRYAERARTEFIRALGVNQHEALQAEDKCGFMVKSLNIEYFAPAILDDLLSVTCEVINLSGARLEMKQEIYCQDKLLVSLIVQLAHVSFSRKRPVRILEALVNKIESL